MLNRALVAELIDDAELILHLAAAVGVRLIVESPVQTIETNIKGTEIVLELAYRNLPGVEKIGAHIAQDKSRIDFEWSENISSIKDSRVRDLAETHHAELEKSFSNIKTSSRDAGAAFRPFLTDLTRLRAKLESHPAAALSPSETNLIAAARDNGQKVLKQLTAINFELTVISTMLDPSKAPARS